MNSRVAYTLKLRWMPIHDRFHYPLKGVHPVFFQNILELIFVVGFVWYLGWSPLLVMLYCIAEAWALVVFSGLKSPTSFGLFQKKQFHLFFLTACSVVLFSSAQLYGLWNIHPEYFSANSIVQMVWNDEEFLWCVLAIVLQQGIEFYKHKKMAEHLPVDRIDSFLNPVLRLVVQQLLLLVVFVSLVYVQGTLLQAIVLCSVWSIAKTLLGQVHLVVIPVFKPLQ